ncbi:MAG: hypothetical protein DWQ31_03775 [Planctomycetota bacterium]|nr:MAG: hypothetical protein DWQ31_03775 [Planctomycetota bacterium]
MGRISSGISAADLSVQRNLLNASDQLQQTTERLSTLVRINRAADDPAGLIASEQIRAELAAIEAADRNAARATATAAVADTGLSQVGSLLNTIEQAVVATAAGGLSDAEVAAYQTEVDAAVEAINRIGSNTQLGGQRLLDGSSRSLTFAFSPDLANTVSLSLPTISAAQLGNSDGTLSQLTSSGLLSLRRGNAGLTQSVLNSARSTVNKARGDIGSFERATLDASRNTLGSLRQQLSGALSMLYDADLALETANRVRFELIQRAAIATVQIAGERHRLTGLLLDEI